MGDRAAAAPRPHRSLSAKLLVLTVAFVMISEVLIYVPSIARYRNDWFEARLGAAHLATLALEATPDNMVSDELRRQLLDHAAVYAIAVRRESASQMLSADAPPPVDAMVDLREAMPPALILDALRALIARDNRVLRVIGRSPKDPAATVEVLIDERPLRAGMFDYSQRILGLSIVISLITATLVYFTLHWLLVRPMRRITASMTDFRRDPDDPRSLMAPGDRTDEIGTAEHELAAMQTDLRGALRQKAHLAALGAAVAKINHDLRNILSTASLLSDRLARSSDPAVRKVAPTLVAAIDRAVNLCSQTLDFAREEVPQPRRSLFALAELMREVEQALAPAAEGRSALHFDLAQPIDLEADRDQIFRVLANLARNAIEAGAAHVRLTARGGVERVEIDVADDGPGLSPKARERLFQPFAGSVRPGGTGLGLAIARDLVRAHGGELHLVETGERGTIFRIELPNRRAAPDQVRRMA